VNNLERKEWRVSDVIIALAVVIGVKFLTVKVLRALYINLLIHSYFISHFADFIGILIAVYFLNKKYLLKLTPVITFRQFYIYIVPALFFNLIFAVFPYSVWLGQLKVVPMEYSLFRWFGTLEKFFFLVSLCLLGPILEEIFYRGFLYRIIRNRYNIFWGAIVSMGIYYIYHGISIDNITIMISGLIFTYVYEKTGVIWNSIIIHSLSNTLWFIFVYWGIKSYSTS